MRMGLAYDYKGNFRLAEKQYAKALEFIPSDVNAAYYQYFAAINGGRKRVAYKAYENYTTAQMANIKKLEELPLDYKLDKKKAKPLNELDHKTIEEVYFEYGHSFTGNENILSDLFPKHTSILYSEGLVRNTQDYIHLSLNGNLSPFINWTAAFSNNTIHGVNLIQPRNSDYYTTASQVKQMEFYGKLGFYSGDGWNIQISGQFLGYNNYYTDVWTDSISYTVPETEDSILLETPHYKEENMDIKGEDAVFSISLNKKVGLIDFSLFGSYASINNRNPFQIGGELSLLPGGNYGLYLTNRVFYYQDDFTDRIIYKVMAGSKITKKLSFEGSATFGDLKFTNEFNSPIVYNWSEKTSFKGDIVFSYQITSAVRLSLRYQITQKLGSYKYYAYDKMIPSTQYPSYYYASYKKEIDQFKFNQHFLILGLYWVL
ncbi:MAG: hypothetical protein B7C24_11895 [Bacteroidetes bacterium 4572_77]|nr:MAG: hypothetical protein B7C24_11895 [Bacteroidetes bacterium 4572_77]